MSHSYANPFRLPFSSEESSIRIGRRRLLQLLAATSLPVSLAVGANESKSMHAEVSLEDPWLSINAVQKQMFPKSINWLSAEQINALPYLQQKFKRPLADKEDQRFLFQGVGWLNDFALSDYQKKFVALSFEQKEVLLQKIAKSRAGENWLSLILDNLIEALLADPVYGGNPKGIGWKATGQVPGYPLPKADKRYFELGYQKRQREYRRRAQIRITKG